MKNIFIVMFIAISMCFAENQQVPKDTIYDTITVKQTIIDTIHMLNYDSVTVAMLEKSQKFYSDSFSNLMTLVAIIITIGCAAFGCFGTFNWWKAKRYNEETKKDLEKTKNDFNNKVSFLENELKEQIENQNKNFKLGKENTFREIAISSLPYIYKHPETDTDINDIFLKIGLYYSVLHRNKVELNEDDFKHFRYVTELIMSFIYELPKSFQLSTIDFFLYSLSEIIEHCKKTKKEAHLEMLNEIQNLLFEVFGQEKVLTATQKSRKWRA